MENYTTENVFGIQTRSYYNPYEDGFTQHTINLEQLLGSDYNILKDTLPEEVVELTDLFSAQYESIKEQLVDSEGKLLTEGEYLSMLLGMGEFNNKMDKPLAEFGEVLLDVLILPPLIEMCMGKEFLTGEDLTETERMLKGVSAVVSILTLGTGIGELSEITVKQVLLHTGKTLIIDVVATGTSYGVGQLCEELGLPAPLTVIFALAAGMAVSMVGTKFVFKDSLGNVQFEYESGSTSISQLYKESTCSNNDLYVYLSKQVSTDAAEAFAKNGIWPSEIQIPKNSSALNLDGSINWSRAPQGGYTLDADGNAIKEVFTPKVGEVIDRYGPVDGRYTSPVIDGKAFSYSERSLPYIEDMSKYHRYEVTGDFEKLKNM